jgi:8-hydroxy-5-deazaflavin:NADPH oxidoreductase
MKVGVLGTGDVGRVLASGFISRGHQVKLGSRDASNEKVRDWVAKNGKQASGGTFADAASYGEMLVLATLWSGTENAINLADPRNFSGKVVIDATNPLRFEPNKPPALALGHTDSGGEQVQRWLSDALVVKAFNIVGNASMVDPQLPGGPPDMFICGNDAGAKERVREVLRSFGWPETIDIGGIEGARELESLCILWVKYGIAKSVWTHAFKVLHK